MRLVHRPEDARLFARKCKEKCLEMEVVDANGLLVENLYVLRANVPKASRLEALCCRHMRHFESARIGEEYGGDRFLNVSFVFLFGKYLTCLL